MFHQVILMCAFRNVLLRLEGLVTSASTVNKNRGKLMRGKTSCSILERSHEFMYTNKYMIFHIGNFLTIYITINYKLRLFFTYILCCIPKFIRSELILIPGICFKWLRIPQNFHYNCDFAFAVFVVIKFHWCVHAFDNSNSNSNFFAA